MLGTVKDLIVRYCPCTQYTDIISEDETMDNVKRYAYFRSLDC